MNKLLLILLFYSVVIHSQNNSKKSFALHHQALSIQASSITLNSGIYISQTIGQQSVIGTHVLKNKTVLQGFQQSLYKLSIIREVETIEIIKVTTYPNPFDELLYFNFSRDIREPIEVSVFDMLGRQVYYSTLHNISKTLHINLSNISSGEYIVELLNQEINYSAHIIKH